MNGTLLKLAQHLPEPVKRPLRSIYEKVFPPHTEPIMYRVGLFDELLGSAPEGFFTAKRILEIGPKDGLDSARLTSLNPSELVLIDLPEKRAGNEIWLHKLAGPHTYIEANFMYLPTTRSEELGKFSLIWCTGVLYHNAEQLRMLRKLYKLLNLGGFLVLESSTMRGDKRLIERALVEIHYPRTYRDTGTVTHLPTAAAIRAWLMMAGFDEIRDSDCYRKYNRELIGQRHAWICRKGSEDEGGSYYHKSGLNPKYVIGDST